MPPQWIRRGHMWAPRRPTVLALSARPVQDTAAARSLILHRLLPLQNASAVRLRAWVGRPFLCLLYCTTLGMATLKGQRRSELRRWQAIDGFRSEQRFCPSTASLGAQTLPAPCAERPLRRPPGSLWRPIFRDRKRTAWSGKGGPRRFLFCTVSPEPLPPKGEAPLCGSSKARPLPDNFPTKGH